MQIELTIIQVLPAQEGVGRNGNPWKVQPYVGETSDQYPRKVYFEVFGEDRIKETACEVGNKVNVSLDIESREFNGRWYTTCRAWKVEKSAAAAEPVQATEAAPAAPASEETEELPF